MQVIAFAVFCVALVASYPQPDHGAPHGLPVPRPGPDGYGKDQYFQYINVPAHKVFEWGYRRGIDPHHFREEYLSQKDHTFKAKASHLITTLVLYRANYACQIDR